MTTIHIYSVKLLGLKSSKIISLFKAIKFPRDLGVKFTE